MNDAREAILARIRRAQGRQALSAETEARLERGLTNPEAGIRPALHGSLIACFVQRAQAAAASVEHLGSWRDIPARVAALHARHDRPTGITVAPHPVLTALAWGDLEPAFRRAHGEDRVAVSLAFAGVAETGSLALASGAETPTTLNFLPEAHVVALARSRVVAHLEDLWALLRRELGALPRAVNLITGPSRTADIEQTIQLGAHGPRRLHVILVDDAT